MGTAATGALHPDIVRFSQEIADTLAQWESLCAGRPSAQASAVVRAEPLSETQFNWSPELGRWSIAQNLAHLNTVNGLDLTPITEVVAHARLHNIRGDGPYKYSWLNNYFIRSMEPPVTKKFKAPKAYVPPPDAPLAATLDEYRRITNAILDQIRLANGLDLKRAKTIMPAMRLLKMPLGARFAVLCAHDRRHLWAARNIRNRPNFPTA